MKQAKFEQLIQGHTGIAKKVYESVPIIERWSIAQIMQYMKTKTGSTADARIVHGCLNSLVDAGLIREEGKNAYARVPVEEKPKEVLIMKPVAVSTNATEPQKKVPAIDLLGGIASDVSAISVEFSARLKRIAKSIEDAALSIESERESNHESVEKLRQLQSLLKSL